MYLAELRIVIPGLVVEKDELFDRALSGDIYGGVHRRMPPVQLIERFLDRVLRVKDENISIVEEVGAGFDEVDTLLIQLNICGVDQTLSLMLKAVGERSVWMLEFKRTHRA